MGGRQFPKSVGEIIETLTELFRHQSQPEIVEVLQHSYAELWETDYDNWNGGITTWELFLELPVALFASIETRLPNIEAEIGSKLKLISRPYPTEVLQAATITPITGSRGKGQRTVPSGVEIKHLWEEGRFRLFLSHRDKYKVQVAALKDELLFRGVTSFVAHEDIEPSRAWQEQIELGLRSMHALAAVVTTDFHTSLWTDQEVGWALGRDVPVINLKVGRDPYGLSGKYQGVPGRLELPGPLANDIVVALLTHIQTHGEMKRALVRSLAESRSFIMSLALCPLILSVDDFTEEEKEQIRQAVAKNDQVYGAYRVADKITAKFGSAKKAKKKVDTAPPW